MQPPQKPGSIGRLDEYEILAVVGKGGFGIVLKAFDENLHRIVAIKVMSPQMAASGTARQRFIREAQAAAAVTHENVVTIHAVKKDAKIPYLVMQFVSGMTLNEKTDTAGALGIKEILRIGTQISEGLAAAHKQGLVHRDIKPGNILLENGVERVKITDFGLARAVDDASLTQSGVVAGTPMYMSPEQAEGLPVDHRSDLFSLGSVLYVMCTGHPPFRASTTMAVLKRVCEDVPKPVQQVNAEIPDWLEELIGKLHAKKPDERFQSAAEVAGVLRERLAELQAGRMTATVAAAASNPSEALAAPTPPGPMRKSRSLTPIVLIAVALCLCFGAPAVAVGLGALLWVFMPIGAVGDREPVAHDLKQVLGHKEQAAEWGVKPPDPGAWNDHPLIPFLDPKGGPNAPDPGPKATDVTDGKSNTVLVGPGQIMSSGWVQLFNGKDLTGWETFDKGTGRWKIVDGHLTCDGPCSYLFTKRDDFKDFHFRVEARLNAKGNSGQYFRSRFEPGWPKGYYAQINNSDPAAGTRTGALNRVTLSGGFESLANVAGGLVLDNAWFTQEVIAKGNHIQILLNGKKVVDYVDKDSMYKQGRLALEHMTEPTRIEFRKVEIKELPP